MPRYLLIGILLFLLGLAGNLLAGWIQQAAWGNEFTWFRIIGTIAGAALILPIIAWLEARPPTPSWLTRIIGWLRNGNRKYAIVVPILIIAGYILISQLVIKSANQRLRGTPDSLTFAATLSETQTENPFEAASADDVPWIVEFSYSFPEDWVWPSGTHQYLLRIDCSGVARDFSATNKFEVSDNAEIISGKVYFRASGIYKRKSGGSQTELIAKIHPSQMSVALINLIRLTQVDAMLMPAECEGMFALDNQAAITLAEEISQPVAEVDERFISP